MDHDADADEDALPEVIACPEPACLVPAEVPHRFVLGSTDGPVEHVRTRCLNGHGFTPRVDTLAPWPVTTAPGALRTGC